MCCGKTLIHILKFCFVLLLMASGIALIATGSAVTGEENSYIDITGSKLMQVAIFEICVGIMIVLISFVGCVWAWKEDKTLMWAYIGLLCMICVMEFSGGIAAFVYKDDVASQTATQLPNTFNTNGSNITTLWKEMQETVGCCGKNSSKDYDSTIPLPTSCCESSSVCTSTETSFHSEGCINATTNALEYDASLVGGMFFGMGIVQVAGLLFTCADVLLVKCIKCMCPCCCS